MKLVEPEALVLPRVYFTEFDRTTYSQYQIDEKGLKELWLDLERKIKLLSLLKGHITIATSHLIESELAQKFITDHSILLKEGIILPALASNYRDFTEFVEAKRESRVKAEAQLYSDDRFSVEQGYPRPSEVAKFLSENTALSVRWDVSKTSEYFRQKLLRDLNDGDSLLRFNLRGTDQEKIDHLTKEIESIGILSRKDVSAIASRSNDRSIKVLVPEYADFIYYLAGALAVKSEGVLPQENLVDFSFTDLISRKTCLSESDIFYRIFVDIIESRVHKYFPVGALDKLSFKEIMDLRKTLLGKNFVEKYNRVMDLAKAAIGISDPEELIFNLQELNNYETELREIFRQCVEVEVYKKEETETARSALRILVNIASVVSFSGVVQSIHKLVVNLMDYFGVGQYHAILEERISKRLRELAIFVDTSSQLEKPIFLEFLKEVAKKYKTEVI